MPNVEDCPMLISTRSITPNAEETAKKLDIETKVIPLNKDYPMIKCKVNKQNNTRIYYLPNDLQYDKIIIKRRNGDCYAKTVYEAESKGFRAAYRWGGG